MAMDLIEIARLEEARGAKATREIAREWRPCGGGVAGKGAPGEWLNQCTGAGLHGPVDRAELEDVIGWWERAGIEPRFEVAPHADEGLFRAFEELRFAVRAFENVFFRELDPGAPVRAVHGAPAGLVVERVDASDERAVREYSTVAMSGFYPPESPPTEEHYATSARVVRAARVHCFVARLEGRAVGAGGMEVDPPACGLFGLSTLAEFRRRGVQQALIAARLNHACALGARLATIGSRPGVATERNVRRMGFGVAYTKVVLARAGEGLVGVVG